MKILMLAPIFHPHIGGVEKHVKRLAEELIKQGHEISIVTIKHDLNLLEFEILNNINIYRMPCINLSKIWFWIYKHKHLIRDADVIHCHDFYSFFFWYSPFRFLYPFKSVFITFHGYEGIIPIPKKILLMRKTTELLTRKNICIGDFIPKWYGTKSDIILYGGVDKPDINELTSNYDYKNNSAVFIGRLEADTGINAYIEAIKIIKKEYYIDIKVDICGDGKLKNQIKQVISDNKLNVNLHGFVENPNSYLVVNNFAFVSGYLAILEAMISKKLVFSIYENDLKKDYLTLIPNSENMMIITSSSKELAEKLVYYCKNPDKAEEKIENAYNFAKNQTWEKIANEYLKLWGTKIE